MPLYFAARAPGGRARRHADHGRRRPHAAASRARSRCMQQVRFRTLGCYPLTGAVESDADTLPAIIQEMLLTRDLRAPGPRDRPRLAPARWRRRSRRATSDGPRSDLIADDIDAYLEPHEHKSLLRFITCGSVDDGKCTLIGRLLYESQLRLRGPARGARGRLEAASARRAASSTSRCWSTAWRPSASRASRSTSPTASSRPTRASSSSPTRPGHEQYTRNMVTGASTADCAVILIDARKGVLTQTRRHSYLVVAARHPPRRAGGQQDGPGRLLARSASTRSRRDYRAFAQRDRPRPTSRCIPLSALTGDNIVEPSDEHALVRRARR